MATEGGSCGLTDGMDGYWSVILVLVPVVVLIVPVHDLVQPELPPVSFVVVEVILVKLGNHRIGRDLVHRHARRVLDGSQVFQHLLLHLVHVRLVVQVLDVIRGLNLELVVLIRVVLVIEIVLRDVLR